MFAATPQAFSCPLPAASLKPKTSPKLHLYFRITASTDSVQWQFSIAIHHNPPIQGSLHPCGHNHAILVAQRSCTAIRIHNGIASTSIEISRFSQGKIVGQGWQNRIGVGPHKHRSPNRERIIRQINPSLELTTAGSRLLI